MNLPKMSCNLNLVSSSYTKDQQPCDNWYLDLFGFILLLKTQRWNMMDELIESISGATKKDR